MKTLKIKKHYNGKIKTYIIKMILWILGTWQAIVWIERLYEINNKTTEVLTAVAVLVVLDIAFHLFKNLFNKRYIETEKQKKYASKAKSSGTGKNKGKGTRPMYGA